MRLDINLATQPYEDVREFYLRWGALLGAALALTVLLLVVLYLNWKGSQDVARRIADVQSRIDAVDKEKAYNQAILNRPENRSTRERSAFLNALIAEKAFSWTQALSDLEVLMPANANVVSIQPKMSDSGQLTVDLVVESQSRESLLQLVRRMENSSHFRHPQIKAENETKAGEGLPLLKFDIGSIYSPDALLNAL